jgi:sugar phosphate isomerase/epimerase
MEPLQREGSKFKFSLAAYSYRRLLQGDNPQLTLFDFVNDCARFGLEGTELTSYYFPADVTPDYLRRLKQHCFRHGLDISGTAVGNDFGHPAGTKRDEQLQLVKRWVDYSEILGAPVIRIFAGQRQGDTSEQELHQRVVSGIEECCQYAGQHGVHLALENHGGPTATSEGVLALVRDIQSPWFGVNLDTGNFRSSDVYGDLQKCAPYALNVQVKVTISDSNGRRQNSDYKRLADLLRAASYRGYVALEFEEEGDPRQECPRQLDMLRAAFGH